MRVVVRVLTTFVIAGSWACQGAALEAQTPSPTGITIYNDGRVLVRRGFPLRVPSGSSMHQISVGMIDPGSLFSLDPEVHITRAVYDAGVDEQSILRRSVGQRLVFSRGTRSGPNNTVVDDTLSALVLGVDPLRLELPNGRIAFSTPGTPLYPASLVRAEPALELAVDSRSGRDRLNVGYFASGAGWRASYAVLIGGGGSSRVTGHAVLQSETVRLADVDVQLLAGSVNQAMPRSLLERREASFAADAMAQTGAAAKVSEQRVGEFHLYSLPGRHALLPGQTTTAALFDPATVPYERTYVVRGEIPYWGFLPRQPEDNEVPVEVTYTLKRARRTDFGDRPLPGGVARIYQADSAGRQQLVGEAAIDHTPAGEDLRLSAGTAFDLSARRIQTSYTTRRDSLRGGWRTTADAEYRVTLTNATDSAATVEVQERRGADWRIVTSSRPPERISSTLTRFRIAVPARGSAVLTYRVRVTW